MALSVEHQVEHHKVPAERTNGRLPVSLFRHEVVEYQQLEQQFGRVLLLQPLSTKITAWLTRPEMVALARKLRRRRPKGGQLSLRGVARELAARGFLNERGKPYAAKSIASMLS